MFHVRFHFWHVIIQNKKLCLKWQNLCCQSFLFLTQRNTSFWPHRHALTIPFIHSHINAHAICRCLWCVQYSHSFMHVERRSGFQLQIYWVVAVCFSGAPNYHIRVLVCVCCVPALMKSITWIFIAYIHACTVSVSSFPLFKLASYTHSLSLFSLFSFHPFSSSLHSDFPLNLSKTFFQLFWIQPNYALSRNIIWIGFIYRYV